MRFSKISLFLFFLMLHSSVFAQSFFGTSPEQTQTTQNPPAQQNDFSKKVQSLKQAQESELNQAVDAMKGPPLPPQTLPNPTPPPQSTIQQNVPPTESLPPPPPAASTPSSPPPPLDTSTTQAPPLPPDSTMTAPATPPPPQPAETPPPPITQQPLPSPPPRQQPYTGFGSGNTSQENSTSSGKKGWNVQY
ncbi:MAG: hypothetical protein A3F12_06210 [Gammaproteobacteria bacterium RIFCSPHIGHO2_12_FULL_38_14]|nr:MAG: hypothetical protein A3F12_06210 [Gammaproteobacteria bacterium RIFCSPHIGHO2_12_FULL_38_14]